MTNGHDPTNIPITTPAVIEIDLAQIEQIILATCHSSVTNASKASREIIAYLAEVFQAAGI